MTPFLLSEEGNALLITGHVLKHLFCTPLKVVGILQDCVFVKALFFFFFFFEDWYVVESWSLENLVQNQRYTCTRGCICFACVFAYVWSAKPQSAKTPNLSSMADDAITHGCIGGPGSPMCIYNGFEHRYRPLKKKHFVIILIEKKINIFQLFVRASGRRSRIQSTLLRTLISFLSACTDFICDFIR